MKRRLTIFGKILVPTLSVLVFFASGWLWHRSFHVADYCYRLAPQPTGSAIRGVGSYRGALVLASVLDPVPSQNEPSYRFDAFKMTPGNGGGSSVLKPIPAFYAKGLGFGISQGRLTLNIPLAWMFPTRTYHAIYVPYYFIMLIAAILPTRSAWRFLRGKKTGSRTVI